MNKNKFTEEQKLCILTIFDKWVNETNKITGWQEPRMLYRKEFIKLLEESETNDRNI